MAERKVCSLEELKKFVSTAKSKGECVVHAHGTFDLLHLGHVKHLKAGRLLGDKLVVTITGDAFVNKGPGRPVFGEHQRAEMLSSLDCVDFVAINQTPDAVPVIEFIQPSVYLKGQDYQNPEGDLTGRIVDEKNAVEAVGGKIHFTQEEMHSSSELINQHWNVYEPQLRELVDKVRGGYGSDYMLGLLEKVNDYKVLVIGDAIIDEYSYVQPMAKSAKENMIASRFQETECFPGGVFATANDVASICGSVDVLTVLGERNTYKDLIDERLSSNVRLLEYTKKAAPTTRKRRFVDFGSMKKLFEVYYMDDSPLLESLSNEISSWLQANLSSYDLVIVNDFGHGMLDERLIKTLCDHSPYLAVNAQSNAGNMGYNLITKYPRADYFCIDAPEARLAARDRFSPISDVIEKSLAPSLKCEKAIVTHGKHGCVAYSKGQASHTVPAFTTRALDTVGAGDGFLSISAPLVHSGVQMVHAALIGNIAGALKTEIIGHRNYLDKVAIQKAITALFK